MDANQLLYFLRGFFELTDEPTAAQIRLIRKEVLAARSTHEIPPALLNSLPSQKPCCDGCAGKTLTS